MNRGRTSQAPGRGAKL